MEAQHFEMWEKVLSIYGPMGGFCLLFGFLIWRHSGRLVDNQCEFTDSIKEQGERATAAIESLTEILTSKFSGNGEEHKDHAFSTYRTNKALSSVADAIQAGASELDPKVSNAVRPHVAAIKDAINSRNG